MRLLSEEAQGDMANALGMVALSVVVAFGGVLVAVIVSGFVLLMAVATVADLVWDGFRRLWPRT